MTRRSQVATIGREEVLRIARLCRLDLEPSELESLGRDLSQILAFMDRVEDLEETEASEPAEELPVVELRADRPGPSLGSDRALAGSAESGEGLFKVPRVIE